jgi:hypothetical protein
MDLMEYERTPLSYKRHLAGLRYKHRKIYKVFLFIKEREKIFRDEFISELKKITGQKNNIRLFDEYITVLKYLGVIRLNFLGDYDYEIEYVQDYTDEFIDEILNNPKMFDSMTQLKRSDKFIF